MKAVCIKCKKELEVIKAEKLMVGWCKCCGEDNFIAGTKGFSYEKDRGVICSCGSQELKLTKHMDVSPLHLYAYECEKCDNRIEIQCTQSDVCHACGRKIMPLSPHVKFCNWNYCIQCYIDSQEDKILIERYQR